MKIFIVIPAFCEEKTIGDVVSKIKDEYDNVVVVDDGSRDNTGKIAQGRGVIVLRHIINRGQGASLKTGIQYALQNGAEVIVTFDADGQHDPQDIKKLVEALSANKVDIVLGSRFMDRKYSKSIPKFRRWLLRAAVIFTRIVSNIKITDTHNGLRAFTRSAAEKIKINQDRMAHASEIFDEISRHKLNFKEIPVNIKYSEYSISKGQGNLSFGKILFKYLIGRLIR